MECKVVFIFSSTPHCHASDTFIAFYNFFLENNRTDIFCRQDFNCKVLKAAVCLFSQSLIFVIILPLK